MYFVAYYSQMAGSLLVALSCLPRFKLRTPGVQMLGVYAWISFAFSLAQVVGMLLRKDVNDIGNIYTLVEAPLVGLLFFKALEGKMFRRVVVSLIFCYVLFCVVASVYHLTGFYSLIRFARDLVTIIMALTYFYYLIKELPEENLLSLPMFWINTSIILFFSGTLILSIMREYVVYKLNNDFSGFGTFRNFLRFAICIIMSYAGWLSYKSVQNLMKSS